MVRIRLDLVLSDFNDQIGESEELILVASQLPGNPQINLAHEFRTRHLEEIAGLAFLNSFLAWEQFVEDSFTLYELGKASPRGYQPARFILPRNRKHALNFSRGDKRFPLWNDYEFVLERANHFFRDGRPYAPLLRSIRNQLQQMKTVRNAIAHHSKSTQEKFETLVRNQLPHYPGNLTPGGFLLSLRPHINPPITYIGHYIETLRWAALRIVP